MGSIKKEQTPFHVIWWDVNKGEFVPYDVMPYLVECYRECKKKRRGVPKTVDEFRDFVEGKSLYMYWARCQYEILLSDWPSDKTTKKVDVYWQIMMNIDVVTRILMDNVGV